MGTTLIEWFDLIIKVATLYGTFGSKYWNNQCLYVERFDYRGSLLAWNGNLQWNPPRVISNSKASKNNLVPNIVLVLFATRNSDRVQTKVAILNGIANQKGDNSTNPAIIARSGAVYFCAN